MLHSTWPRYGATATCRRLRAVRPYSSSRGDNRTLPDRPSYASAPRGRTRTYDRRDKLRSRPQHRDTASQQRQQAERNLRKRLVEGNLSLAEQADAAAAIEGLGLKEITVGLSEYRKDTTTGDQHASNSANTNHESDGGQWSLLKRRQRSGEPDSAPGNAPLFNESETTTTNTPKWPLLKRREPSYGYMDLADMPADDSTDIVATPSDVSTDLIAATRANLAKKGVLTAAKSHTMIRIDGLSTNVQASDFYRLADNDLSKWNQSINKVQQVRDRMTLEPTGTYTVTFSSAVAATAYAARFQRLHALARIRAHSRTGLWGSEVPADLLLNAADTTTTTQDDLEAELARLSIVAGVQDVALAHRRVGAGPESNKVQGLVAGDGLGERPPVVLIDVAPAAPLERVRAAVRQHGQRARGSWGLARAHPVAANMHQQLQRLSEQATAYRERLIDHREEGDEKQAAPAPVDEVQQYDEEAEKQLRTVLRKRDGLRRVARHLEGAALRRFVVAFRDKGEAQRFHRLWNGRWLGGRDKPPAAGAPRHFVRTQVLDY